MNVVVESEKLTKKEVIIYSVIMAVCVIAILIAFYFQFYADPSLRRMLGMKNEGGFGEKTEEQTQILVSEFDQIFTNTIENEENQPKNVKKKESDKSIIYTALSKKESKPNSYDIDVKIPYINIDNEKVDEYNKAIEDFTNKMNSILESTNKNTIYTVEYVANIQDDILSLMVRSNLKEGSSAQRVIIQTYNYDLRNNKLVTLEEILQRENVNKTEIQQKIENEITNKQKQVEDLKNLGYNIYSRDITNDMYEIENSTEFYLVDETLYIIYAYGNETFTSEMDLVVI